MWRRTRCALVALLACGSMAAIAGSAHANRLEFSSLPFRMTWTRTFRLRDTEGPVECSVTLEGTFHSRTFMKVRSVLIGFITRAAISECVRGSAGFLAETLPWHVQYEGFTGTLPTIEQLRVQITEAGISLRTGNIATCLARSSALNPLKMSIGVGMEERLVTVRLVETEIPYRESAFCTGINMRTLSSVGEFLEPSGGRVRLRLI